MVRPCIHALAHLGHETVCIGPSIIFSQWSMERTMGNLGEEIKQHSNAFANLGQRCLCRCQVNTLKALIPSLAPPDFVIPSMAEDCGDGYILLAKSEKLENPPSSCEADAIERFIQSLNDPTLNIQDYECVKRWAHLNLPTWQIARSRWKEERLQLKNVRIARNVKVCQLYILK